LAHPWKIHYWPFPAKIFLAHPWKIHYWPLPGKKLPAPMVRGTCSSIEVLKGYMDGESLEPLG